MPMASTRCGIRPRPAVERAAVLAGAKVERTEREARTRPRPAARCLRAAADGVETADQLAFLARKPRDQVRGFLIGVRAAFERRSSTPRGRLDDPPPK